MTTPITRHGDTPGDSPITGNTPAAATANHEVLDGSVHPDTVAGTVVQGDLMIGNATPKWARLAVGAVSKIVKSDGTDVIWGVLAASELSNGVTGAGPVVLGVAPTIIVPVISSFISAQHDHADAAGGGALAVKYRTVTKVIYIAVPTATDSFMLCRIPKASTITEITGITNTGTVDFNIEERSTADVAGTDLLASDAQAATTEVTKTSFSNAAIAVKAWLHYAASAVASTPTELWVTVTYTID